MAGSDVPSLAHNLSFPVYTIIMMHKCFYCGRTDFKSRGGRTRHMNNYCPVMNAELDAEIRLSRRQQRTMGRQKRQQASGAQAEAKSADTDDVGK